mgnify:CR=1 FL=1
MILLLIFLTNSSFISLINTSLPYELGALKIFAEAGMKDKEKLFKYRRSSRVNIYSIEDYKDYFYGYMAPSTGYVNAFKLNIFARNYY